MSKRWVAFLAVILIGAATGCSTQAETFRAGGVEPSAAASDQPSPSPSAEQVPSAAAAPANLQVIDYGPAPKGFPADATPMAADALSEGLRATAKIPVYDAPGGVPRAFLAPDILGYPLTMPIVERRTGWVAVLLPSVNRTVGWLPPTGWTSVPLRDHVVVRLSTHELSWYRDGALRQTWKVTIGTSATPTPLGRTFMLARTVVSGAVYAGVDALALGAMPEDPSAVATGLRGAHIGIHAWSYNDFGVNKSNGCIRMPKAAQQVLLDALAPGTAVIVLN